MLNLERGGAVLTRKSTPSEAPTRQSSDPFRGGPYPLLPSGNCQALVRLSERKGKGPQPLDWECRLSPLLAHIE